MKRLLSLAVVVTLTALSLTACSASDSVVPNSHVTIAEVGTITTLNSDVVSANFNKVASDVALLTQQNFYEVDKNGELAANPSFGTVRVVKQNPFTVSYKFGKAAIWSDGSKLDSTDLALSVFATKFKAFHSIRFGSSLSDATIVGTPKIGENSLTLEFKQPIADWKTVLDVTAPAHIVGKVAGISGNVAAVRAGLLAAFNQQNQELIATIAAAYANAFIFSAPADNFVTNGAYVFKAVAADKLVLSAERDYAGLHSGIAETINIVTVADNAAAFKQIASGKADVFAPQETLSEPQSDLVTQSQALGTKSVTVLAPVTAQSEQFVINLKNGSLADSNYRSAKTAQTLRKAFLNIVPKARAIDFASMTQSISKSDSFVYSASSKNYSAVVGSNGSSNFVLQDTEKSSELIIGIQLPYTPTVRVLFDSDNPAAIAEWTLLSDHAATSGLRLTNVSSPDPSVRLNSGDYEVFLGPQPLLGVGSGSVQQLTNGPSKMPIETYIELTKDVLASTDTNLSAALQSLDKKLFDLGFGLPMYQLTALLVFNNRVQGLTTDPFGTNSTWGYWTWHVSADK